jgi:hypothetical protein
MSTGTDRIREGLRRAPLPLKGAMLVAGAAVFFVLFPFLQRYFLLSLLLFGIFLAAAGILFFLVSERSAFKAVLVLWAAGSVIYMAIAVILIIRGVQPLSYITLDTPGRVFYYASYPLRVLGIFFVGLLFSHTTSPAEFLRWGELGVRITLAYRAFEYSVQSLGDTKGFLIVQGHWPDSEDKTSIFGMFVATIRSVPYLVATMMRNLILWFPWAYISYTRLRRDLERRKV